MIGSFLATWIKLRRPALLGGTYGGIALVTGLLTTVIFLSAGSADAGGPGQGVTIASLSLSGGLLQGLTSSASLLGLIALSVAAAQTAGDYVSGSLRNLLIREPRRLRLLAGTWSAIVTFTLGAVAVAAVVAGIVGYVVAHSRGIDTGAWFTGSGLSAAVRTTAEAMLAGAGYATLGAVLGSVLRTPVPAIALGAAWLLPVELIVSNTVSGSDRWLPGQLLSAISANGTATISLATAALTTAIYLLLAGGLAGALFRRRDVTA